MDRKMKINTLGQVLKYYRKKHDFRQEKLCSGICSVATLSKIERGNRIVDSLNAECLLGRMGKEVLQFEILLNDEDYAAWNLREEIQKYEKESNYKKAAELLQIYEKQMPKMESVHEQFLLYHRAKVKIAEQAETEEITALLYHALKCTKPEMDTNEEEALLYNPIEIELILLLIHYNYPEWSGRDKEEELLKILNYVRKVYTGRQLEETTIRIFLGLIEAEQELGDYVRVLKYIDEAIDTISQGRGIEHIAELHFMKARMLEQTCHQKVEWKEREKDCREECLMAYYVFDLLGQKEEIEELQRFCEEKMGWQIIE